MEINNITTLLFCGASIAAGAFLGALRSKLFASKTENKFHYAFYAFGGITILGSVLAFTCNISEFIKPNWFAIMALLLALIFSIALLVFTKKYLIVKSIYNVNELTPIINKFTDQADKNEIKLYGGDLNFFGNSPADLDSNSQYSHLKSKEFKHIYILCEEPIDTITQLRYGKMYHDLLTVELRFYNPEKADLKVRGRIIKVQGSSRLLMYTKHTVGMYQALETDTSNSGGALYDNIWDLTWSMAKIPTTEQIQQYKSLYNGR